MENEVEGDFLLPCTECTKDCFRIHGKKKLKNKENSDGYSYFFKIMLDGFERKLSIPPAFVPKLRSENGNRATQSVVLQGPRSPRGLRSPRLVAKLWSSGTGLELGRGWEKFVQQYRIEWGDFLVFKYIGWSYFKVKIFGRSGCEKNPSVVPEKKLKKTCRSSSSAPLRKCDQNVNDELPFDLGSNKKRRETVIALESPKKEPNVSPPRRRGRPPKIPQYCNQFESRKRQRRKISRDVS